MNNSTTPTDVKTFTVIGLSEQDNNELSKAVHHAKKLPLHLHSMKAEHFPINRLHYKIDTIRNELEYGIGVVQLKGLKYDQYSIKELEILFMGIGQHLGTPVSQSHIGEMVYHVKDQGGKIGEPGARGSNTKQALPFHTDRSDVIGFLCVKQAEIGGNNRLILSRFVHDIIKKTRPDLLNELYKNFYWQKHRVDLATQQHYHSYPIFSLENDNFVCQYLRKHIEWGMEDPNVPNITEKQIEALDYLDSILERKDLIINIKQQPGEMLFINNFTVLHSREAFEDTEGNRLLLRLWLSMNNSRPLPDALRSVYHQTEAGGLRGGMLIANK